MKLLRFTKESKEDLYKKCITSNIKLTKRKRV